MTASTLQTFTITTPSDFHLHVRDKELLRTVIDATSKVMHYGLIMPNLSPPVVTTEMALQYKRRILTSSSYDFTPLMTLYITENLDIAELDIAKQAGIIGLKLYPAGATTNSDNGVKNIKNIYQLLERMQQLNLPLLIHGEVVDKEIDIFDREKVFIDKYLIDIVRTFPELRIVFEHITTRDAVQFVEEASSYVAATITPHHLINNRNDMLASGIKPHYYCLPILKAETHRKSLVKAATSGNPKFFLGTDSAPHLKIDKESYCGCAGCFNAPHAIGWYASLFESVDALDKLEGFASLFGANFYKLPVPSTQLTLVKQPQIVNTLYYVNNDAIVPYNYGKEVMWSVEE